MAGMFNMMMASGGKASILGDTWTLRTSGTTNNLHAVYRSDNAGAIFAVGAGGVLLRSLDGITWSPRTSGTSQRLVGLIDGAGGVYAYGDAGTIIYSFDGLTWSNVTSGTTQNLVGACPAASGRAVFARADGLVQVLSAGKAVIGTGVNVGTYGGSAAKNLYFDFTYVWNISSSGQISNSTDSTGTSWATVTSSNFNGFYGNPIVKYSNGWMLSAGDNVTTPAHVGTPSDEVEIASPISCFFGVGMERLGTFLNLVWGSDSGTNFLLKTRGDMWTFTPVTVPTTQLMQGATWRSITTSDPFDSTSKRAICVGMGGAIITSDSE